MLYQSIEIGADIRVGDVGQLEGVSKRSRLGYTVYYAGSEYKVKIREMQFLRILVIICCKCQLYV